MKNLYNWFHHFYSIVERSLGSSVAAVVDSVVSAIPEVRTKRAVEYACGSGLLTLKLAEYFSHIEGRDVSQGMLGKAKKRMNTAGHTAVFSEGNILEINAPDNSCDWAFVSFALHLFSPEEETIILSQLIRISREGVIIIDHKKRWNPAVAFIEWLEGSYYDIFIKTDFALIAKKLQCTSFKETIIKHSSVMIFLK